MVNHVKPLLNIIISLHQSSFILRRNIHHNTIIEHNMIHVMKRMKNQKVFISIKINLEKADNWKFINQCLLDCKFFVELINLIYYCISSTFFHNFIEWG